MLDALSVTHRKSMPQEELELAIRVCCEGAGNGLLEPLLRKRLFGHFDFGIQSFKGS
jgi:hypothetical protein